jgi:hypothetical protein
VRQLLAGVPVRIVAVNHDTSIVMIERTYSRYIGDHPDALVRAALLDASTPLPAMWCRSAHSPRHALALIPDPSHSGRNPECRVGPINCAAPCSSPEEVVALKVTKATELGFRFYVLRGLRAESRPPSRGPSAPKSPAITP